MELLIIKSADQYIRCQPQGYSRVGIDKASVFPISQESKVLEHLSILNHKGFPDLEIRKLVITEKAYIP